MNRLLLLLLGAPLAVSAAARAADAPLRQGQPPGCGLASDAAAPRGPDRVTIDCVGVTREVGERLAGVLTDLLQHRLDPKDAAARLAEAEGPPEGAAPRGLSDEQGQAIVKTLAGTTATVSVVADPDGAEPSVYALAIATRLGVAGWRIAGSQIRRAVPPGLADISGLALVVRDEKALPEKASLLKKAMAAAAIVMPVISNPQLGPDTAMLWIGPRPTLHAAAR